MPDCLKPLMDLLGYPANAISPFLMVAYALDIAHIPLQKGSPLEFRFRWWSWLSFTLIRSVW